MDVVTSSLLSGVEGVRHAFFTRHGGVSRGVYESLNVGLGSKDSADDVAENRRRCAGHFGVGPDALLTCYQIHSAEVVIADRPWHGERPQADGVTTGVAGLVCGALSADCAPVLLVDPEANVVAAAHAGWGGAYKGVVESAIAAMVQQGARVERMVCAIGPCIGPNSYEVGLEFLDRFLTADPANERFFRPGAAVEKRQFDLPAYVLERVRRAGVRHAEWTGHDTCADPRFFSNRRAYHNGEQDYGRLLSAIMIEVH
jgi:polyphenol oxidase